ncbi:MAG: hypothetical protein IKP20_02575 [Candidatus Methanomethylophilaceae archaeon]|nr:hypothetical protein [Candidatus Methanomethylophilaceae archaeon]
MGNKNSMILIVCALAILAILAGLFLTHPGEKSDAGKKSLETVNVGVYNMSYLPYDIADDRYYEDAKPLSEYKNGDFQFKIVEGEKEVLYITLEDFARMYSDDYTEGCTGAVTTSGNISTWTIKDKSGKEVYHMTIDAKSMTISGNGRPYEAIKPYEIKNTLMEQVKNEATDLENADKEYVYSFKGYGLDPIVDGGKVYYPIGLLSVHAQHEINRAFLYSSADKILFEFAVEDQKEMSFDFGKYESTATIYKVVEESFKQYEKENDGEVTYTTPMYVLEHTKSLFYYLMDNYYGLASVLGYKSMGDYFRNTTYEDDFLSENPRVRSAAYGVAVSLLNDAHSGFTGSRYIGENAGLAGNSYLQTLNRDRLALNQLLSSQRDAELKKAGDKVDSTDVRYSSDGKTAYFSFNDFYIATYFKDPMDDYDRNKDAYYLFVKNLNEMKNKGGVERVVIDDSLNGGGYVMVMGKILALISKNNYAELFFKDESNGQVIKYSYQVDSNGDGKYDTDDCFGLHFKFYILTSAYSFSCGNAFPYYAKAYGLAITAGTASGGGECTVDTIYLPFGQKIAHSATTHVGIYDAEKKEFTGVERGASADISIDVNPYNVDQMSAAIEAYEKLHPEKFF